MVKCPRCEHVVDETKRATCPICFTPLQAPAAAPLEPPALTPPYAAPPLPGQPVPLDAPPLLPRSAPPPGSPQTPQPLNQPQPLNRPAYTQAPPCRPEKAGSGITTTRKRKAAANTTLGTIVSAVVLALIGFGGIGSYLRADTLAADNTPKAQAEKFFAALAKLDWKGIYATSDVDRERYPTEAAFVREMQAKMDAQPQAKEILSTLFRNMRVRVGEPAVEEDTATVPVTLILAAQGREASSTTEIEMRKVNGVWKREPEDSDPDSVIGVPGMGSPEDTGGMGTTGDPGGLPASPANP